MDDILVNIARKLRLAEKNATPIDRVSDDIGSHNIDAAYRIQTINATVRLNNGALQTGHKIGLTSPEVQVQLGIDQPDFGVLFDTMEVADAGDIEFGNMIAPKVEGEIAFRLKKDIDSRILDEVDLLDYIDYMCPAIEVVDSRIRDWDITIADTIADNASAAFYVLGQERQHVRDFDIISCQMSLFVNEELRGTGVGKACMGNPLKAVKWLSNAVLDRHDMLQKGQWILSGALGKFVDVVRGDKVRIEINGLGHASVSFK